MKKLKPGMLCLVVGVKNFTENIGKVVTLIRLVQPYEENQETGTRYIGQKPAWIVEGKNLVTMVNDRPVVKNVAYTWPEFLMPLEDDGDNETMDERVESTMGIEA